MKRIISILLAGGILTGLLTGCGQTSTEGGSTDPTAGFAAWEPSAEEPAVAGMKVALENTAYRLSVDPETGDCAVINKQTGQVLHTNPCRAEELAVEEETGNRTIASVTLQYYDSLKNLGTYNTIDDCLPYGQLQYWIRDDTLRIIYTLGKDNEKDILPETLSVEAYEDIVNTLSGTQARAVRTNYMLLTTEEMTNGVADAHLNKEEYLRLYPGLKERDLYVLRDISDAKKHRVSQALEEYGFTYEDVVEQRRISGLVYQNTSVQFAVPVDMTLDAEGFTVAVEPSLIQATKGHVVKNLELYPGMGATTAEGRFLVPDGSGSTIPLHTADTASYSQRIYGEDEVRIQSAAHPSESEAILPYYAIVSEKMTLFADVTSGAAMATVQAVPMGGLNAYARASFLFTITETDTRESSSESGEVESLLVAKRAETGRFAVHYRFSDRQETYAEMAVAYRERLTAAGLLKKKGASQPVMLLDLYGLMQRDGSIMGIPVTEKVPLTTFSQAQVILKALKAGGVGPIRVRYLGMANGGLQNSIADRLRIESQLGGKKGWAELTAYAAENSVTLYPDAPVGHVYTDSWFDSFSKSDDGCRLISGQLASLVKRRVVDNKKTTEQVHYALSATALRKLQNGLVKDLKKQDITAVSFSTIGRLLNPNFNRKDFSTRTDMQAAAEELLTTAQDNQIRTMVDTGHLYTLAYADTVVNVPASNSGLHIEDRSVPFAQIVMSGCMDYAMRAFNSTSDRQWERLRAIETGASVYYRFMYEDNILLKKSEYEDLNSIQYSVWLDQAQESYRYVSEALERVQGAQICDHIYLTEEVTCTTYDNDVKIYVNYSDQPYVTGEITVPAEGYALGGAL